MLIGISGHIGSGKSSTADYLIKKYGFQERTFAGPLKEACRALFLLSDEQLYGSQEQKATADPRWYGASPRSILQFVGTDLLRNRLDEIMSGLGNDVFIHNFRIWYSEFMAQGAHPVVVSDVRFPNEVDAIRSFGGKICRISRNQRCVHASNHSSETSMLDIKADYEIDNNGTIEQLYDQLDIIMKDFNKSIV